MMYLAYRWRNRIWVKCLVTHSKLEKIADTPEKMRMVNEAVTIVFREAWR